MTVQQDDLVDVGFWVEAAPFRALRRDPGAADRFPEDYGLLATAPGLLLFLLTAASV